MILTGKHNFVSDIESAEELHLVPNSGREIEIGNNCYIGSGAIIIGPVKIGNYSVVGAGAVVTKDIQAYTLVSGVPAKEIKKMKPLYEKK
jgi:acetyltransferase-like isoleucine patch superfamily enzyme